MRKSQCSALPLKSPAKEVGQKRASQTALPMLSPSTVSTAASASSWAGDETSLQHKSAALQRYTAREVMVLQRMVGNQVVQRLLSSESEKRKEPLHSTASPRAGTQDSHMTPTIQAVRRQGESSPSPVAQGVVQRKMSFRQSDLIAGKAGKKTLKQKLGYETTWDNLMGLLGEYEQTQFAEKELESLQKIEQMVRAWLVKHAKYGKKSKDPRVIVARQLYKAVQIEMPRVEAQAQYITDLGAQKEGKRTPFKYLRIGDQAYDTAKLLAGGGARQQKNIGADAEARDTAAKYKLTDAEIAALQTYTANDFTYMNPAMSARGMLAMKDKQAKIAGLHTWLSQNLDEQTPEDDPKRGSSITPEQRAEAKAEGKRHGLIAMQALMKLPDYQGIVYRGQTLTPEDLASRYQVGKRISYEFLISSSKDRSVSEKFAAVKTTGKGKPVDGKVGVLMIINLKAGGKDISMLSTVGKEQEVLWLPGQELLITKVIPEGQTGKPYTIVEATQVLKK